MSTIEEQGVNYKHILHRNLEFLLLHLKSYIAAGIGFKFTILNCLLHGKHMTLRGRKQSFTVLIWKRVETFCRLEFLSKSGIQI